MKKILYNAKVYVEREVFAEAVLEDDGIIKAVGTNDDILAMRDNDTEVIDCGGRTLLPGLNDSHLHVTNFGEVLNQADIAGSKSIDDMVERCRKFAAEHPERIKHGMHAAGWNQDLFEDGDRLPTRHDLDRISTEYPIILDRVCGHIVTSNTKAIEMLGIDGNSPQYPGGTFYIGDDGYPNGIFAENAANFVKELIPDFTLDERREMLIDTMKYCVAHGLTSVQSNDIGCTILEWEKSFDMFHDVFDKGEGLLRYRHQVCFNEVEPFVECLEKGEYAQAEKKYKKGSWLTLGPLKLFKDGSLGARTALMKHGYVGNPDDHGIEWISHEDMKEFCRIARDHGVQVVTHCIGDDAVDKTIDCYKEAFVDGKNKLRHAIVHCQITDEAILNKIAENDILVFAQPIFLDYDMHIVEKLCGKELASTSYAFGSLIKKGAHVSFGTDCPVELCDPFPNMCMAITRQDKSGFPEGGFYPKECVSLYDAIDAYTIESAYAEFQEDVKGRIKPGYYADMILLDQDIFTIDPKEIKNILPVMTMVGGKIVYDRM